jgi:hypothetical protein
MGFAQCVRLTTLGFPTARFARYWDFPKIARKMLGSRWDEVP